MHSTRIETIDGCQVDGPALCGEAYVTIFERGDVRAEAVVVLESSQQVHGREIGEERIELGWLDRERLRTRRPIRCWLAGQVHLLYQR